MTVFILVNAVHVRVQVINSSAAVPPSIVSQYLPVGSATPESSVALSSVAEVAQIAVFRLSVVLNFAAMRQSVFILFIVLKLL